MNIKHVLAAAAALAMEPYRPRTIAAPAWCMPGQKPGRARSYQPKGTPPRQSEGERRWQEMIAPHLERLDRNRVEMRVEAGVKRP